MLRTLNFTPPSICDGVQRTVLSISTEKATDRYSVEAYASDMNIEVRLIHQGDNRRSYVVDCDHKGKPLTCSCPAWKWSSPRNCRHVAAVGKLVEIRVIKTWEGM